MFMNGTDDKHVKRVALLKAVAALLPGFSYHVPENGHRPHLAGPDGMKIFISTGQENGKLHVHGSWPNRDGDAYMSPRSWGAVPYNAGSGECSINVGEERGPEAIARDIQRRFLPTYTATYAACLQKKAEHDEYRDKLYQQALLIAKAAGLPRPERLDSNSDYRLHLDTAKHGCYGDVTVYNDSMNLKLSGVSVKKTERILAILRERR